MRETRRVLLVLLALVVSLSCARESTSPTLSAARQLRLLWRSPTSWRWLRTPAIADTCFYLMVDFGSFSQLSISEGRVLQQVSTPEVGDCERPLVDGASVFACFGNSNVRAFDRITLAPQWSTYVYPPDSVDCCGTHIEWSLSPPAVDSAHVFCASQDGNLYCLDRTSGASVWKRPLGASSVVAPVIRNGVVFTVGSDSCFSAFGVTTGALLWHIRLGEPVDFTEPKAVGPLIYMAGRGGSVFCIDVDAGSVRWSRKVGIRFRGQISASEALICAADEQGIYGLDPATGTTKWQRDLQGEGPQEAHGRIYCFASDHDLLVLDLESGAILGYFPVGEPGFFNQPVVVGDRIIAAARGEIFCLGDITD